MSDDFELVETTRLPDITGETKPNTVSADRIVNAAADNFGTILDIVKDVVDIKKMQVQSELVLAKMAEDRKMLLAEAEVYVMKKNTDTKNVVDRMKMIRMLLRDFYVYNHNNTAGLSGEDFSKIITELLAKTE
jgi:hypothetical protein